MSGIPQARKIAMEKQLSEYLNSSASSKHHPRMSQWSECWDFNGETWLSDCQE